VGNLNLAYVGDFMKKWMFLMLIVPLLFGCSQTQGPTTTTTTTTAITTTTLFPAVNTFLGLTLGASSNEVISTLGNPDSISTSNSFITYQYEPYIYLTQVKEVTFTSNYEIVAISCRSDADYYNLKGVIINKTADEVKALLGDYESMSGGTTYFIWFYPLYNIYVEFYYSSNKVYKYGVYNPNKVTLVPN